MQLDHITIVAGDCRRLRDFFVEVAGMQDDPGRPSRWPGIGSTSVTRLCCI
jgi:catechol 2,3-dioxygenase-like lactoylglutathione lyase family enzyme